MSIFFNNLKKLLIFNKVLCSFVVNHNFLLIISSNIYKKLLFSYKNEKNKNLFPEFLPCTWEKL
jgi:hypothetical protein